MKSQDPFLRKNSSLKKTALLGTGTITSHSSNIKNAQNLTLLVRGHNMSELLSDGSTLKLLSKAPHY